MAQRTSWRQKFSLPRSARGIQGRAKSTRRSALHIEKLEDRFLMNGDPAPIMAADLTLASNDLDISGLVSNDFVGYSHLYSPIGNPAPTTTVKFDQIDELPTWLVEEADRRHGELFGTSTTLPVWNYWGNYGHMLLLATDSADTGTTSSSSTNTQVAGIDEADLVETDGNYLYIISGQELLILDVREIGKPTLASRVRLNTRPTGMYLDGERLTLIANKHEPFINQSTGSISLVWDTAFTPNNNPITEIQVFDLTDHTSPKLVQRTEIDGGLISSRMVDGQLRLALQQNSPNLLPGLQTFYVGTDETTNQRKYRYETRDEYLSRVHELVMNAVPSYRVLSGEGTVLNEQSLLEIDQFQETTLASSSSQTITIATFNTRGNSTGPADTKTVFADHATTIYSTENSVYVFSTSNGWYNPKTTITKFDFNSTDHSIQLSAEGQIDGRVQDQFSIDEHEGYLRVVSSGNTWGSGQTLTVLQQDGNQLNTVGKLEGLAPGENLHSVRFIENEAFVVTFRNIDPLFAINLSDPTNPVVEGELKIPGFSDYLQPLGENHLLGIGRGADEQQGLFQELQVSIFEVGDLSDPQLTHRYSFGGGRSTTSNALGEHHAFGYFPSSEILAIPIYSSYQGSGIRWGVDNTAILGQHESALQVFRVDTETGFEPLTLIKHDSRIIRSLQIGEQLVVISADKVTIHDLENPNELLAEINLNIGSEAGLVVPKAYFAPPARAPYQRLTTRPISRSSFPSTTTPEVTTIASVEEEPNITPASKTTTTSNKALNVVAKSPRPSRTTRPISRSSFLSTPTLEKASTFTSVEEEPNFTPTFKTAITASKAHNVVAKFNFKITRDFGGESLNDDSPLKLTNLEDAIDRFFETL